MVETEIWPNLLRECRRRGVKTAIVNGRLSPRSFSRYRLVAPLMRRVMGDIDRFCVQSEEAARRFIELGANPGTRRRHRQPQVRFAQRVVLAGAGARARSRAALLPRSRVAAGARGRQHRERRGGERPARVPASAIRQQQRAAGDRAAPSRAFCRSRSALPLRRLEGRQAQRPGHRRRAARRHRRARHDRRAGHALSGRHRRVRRRQPGQERRPQHSRARGVRQADRLRSRTWRTSSRSRRPS